MVPRNSLPLKAGCFCWPQKIQSPEDEGTKLWSRVAAQAPNNTPRFTAQWSVLSLSESTHCLSLVEWPTKERSLLSLMGPHNPCVFLQLLKQRSRVHWEPRKAQGFMYAGQFVCMCTHILLGMKPRASTQAFMYAGQTLHLEPHPSLVGSSEWQYPSPEDLMDSALF